MTSRQIFPLGMCVLVILACTGCVGGGSNVQVFENDWGKVQFDLPKKMPLTSVVGSDRTEISIEDTFVPFIIINFENYSYICRCHDTHNPFTDHYIAGQDPNTAVSNDNHDIYWNDYSMWSSDNFLELPIGATYYEGYIDYGADKNLVVEFVASSVYADPKSGKYINAFDDESFLSTLKSFTFLESKTRPTEIDQEPGSNAANEASTLSSQDGHQQLIEAVNDLENATLDSIDYSTHQTADSYALLATAAGLTPWWGEASRLALDTINSVVGAVMTTEEFLTPGGAKKALSNPDTFMQILNGIKDSKNIIGAISVGNSFRGIHRDAESYKLSFDALSEIEDAARKEYEISEDNTRAANVAWLELWKPSTTYGLLIPLKSSTAMEDDTHNIVWVNGIKATEGEIKKSFDDFKTQIPDPLPSDYPLNETLIYLEDLTNNVRSGGNRVIGFNVIRDGEIKTRAVTLGLTQADRETADFLYNAWMNKQDVQYESTLYNTGNTIISLTAYGLRGETDPVTETGKPLIYVGSEAIEYVDAARFFNDFPTELAEEILIPTDPLGALQGHSISMTDDLITEVSSLWMISDETLRYLQYTLGSSPTDSSSIESISDLSAPSENDDTSNENTKTAYTKDGITFISEERLEQNIRAGLTDLDEYEKVQVPLDTFVYGASPE